ncbi:DUF2778 domain-containing protein [Trinickia violacea]|uniref:DUF2778 domain-containing protein n=1 Tax=Trinickia violacea TaxID=2571746 RepID=A0A4P8IQE9_9BURK|nr:tlde1 domain-containing protein [Trinickia violacea]QCP50237.1 DUF2778 domain-containing protein [Trinickia violacea]
MPITCTFKLNNKTFSTLYCAGVGNFTAFSGSDAGRDNPAAVAKKDIGPLPPGRYYIVDRQSGGLLGGVRDFALDHLYGTDRTQWFALYRNAPQSGVGLLVDTDGGHYVDLPKLQCAVCL